MNFSELSRASLDDVLAWAADEPWCRAMADCQQDEGWHAEGDVWTHTQMVCRQLPLLDDWPQLSEHERRLLLFTSLFHDSAKPFTTRLDPETGRMRSPRHSVEGERLARAVLRDLGCDLATREAIAALVRLHGRPPFVLSKPDPAREVISLSWLASNRLLYLFALADNRGRSAGDQGRPEENLHLAKVVAEENNCFQQPYPFANDQARFLFYRQPKFDLHYVPYEEYRCTVTLMSGLPGSGKDTWLASHRPGLPVVSLDEIRSQLGIGPEDNQGHVIQRAKERCRELLRAKQHFAFNATNLLPQTRQRWIDLFVDYDARIEIVYVEPPLAVILEQNRERPEPVPEHVILDLAEKCEPPTIAECHALVLVDR